MSKKKREEIIRNLTNTIQTETAKSKYNEDLIQKLKGVLESIENGTYVSKLRKKRKK
jgi:hypothetical protein